jgi:DNA-binding NtrC family response regulator
MSASNGKLRVLIVDDSPGDAELAVRALERSGRAVDWERVESADGVRAALREDWDVVLSDWAMPAFSGEAALRLVDEAKAGLPCLIVSGTLTEEVTARAERAGARACLSKDQLERLAPAVERALLPRR